MASENRATSHAVEFSEALKRMPHAFGFFQALRQLECTHQEKPRLGTSLRPADDPVRLGQEPSLAFAPSTLASFEPGKQGGPGRLGTYFFGLFGPNGPLPLHLTEYAHERLRNARDPTFARFLDVFHHRMLTLFYRAWASAQPTVSFDRPETDRFAEYVGALFGLSPSKEHCDVLSDRAMLYYAGRLACPTLHPEGLKAMLQEFFDLPVAIEEFIGQWLVLPNESHCRLGVSPQTGTLGVTTLLGSRVWDRQCKFRITLGPLGMAEYHRLLPGSDNLRRLVALVREYVSKELSWDLNLILKKEEVTPLKLGSEGQLGWTTWLITEPLKKDAKDLLLTVTN